MHESFSKNSNKRIPSFDDPSKNEMEAEETLKISAIYNRYSIYY